MDYLEEAKETPVRNWEYLATLINPKTHRLFDIWSDRTEVLITLPVPSDSGVLYVLGSGYFDPHDTEYTEMGGYVRSHSPSGVRIKGEGLGFLLYGGAALLAYTKEELTGIFSVSGDRSGEASAFWNRMIEKGFADEECTEGYGSSEVTHITYPIDAERLQQLLEEEVEGSDCGSQEIEDFEESVEVEVTYQTQKRIQTISAHSIAYSGTLLTWNDGNSRMEDLTDVSWKKPPIEVLYDIKLDSCYDPELIVFLIEHIRENDPDPDEDRLLALLETMPVDLLTGASGEFEELADRNPRLHRMMLELAGQQAFDFDELARKQEQMTRNPTRHSSQWRQFFGGLEDVDF